MLRNISLGSVGLVVGGVLALLGFIAYGTGNSTLNLVGFFYGIPILLGGLALKVSELKPIPLSQSSPEIMTLRQQQATATQNQVRQDVTRYRYGQEAHLDEVLARLGLSPTDEERPVLERLEETAIAGHYALVMYFNSPLMPLEIWEQKQAKLTQFFGPGITATVAQPAPETIELALIAQEPAEVTAS